MVKSNAIGVAVGSSGGSSAYDDFGGYPAGWQDTSDNVTTPNGLWHIDFLSGGFAKILTLPDGTHCLQCSSKLDVLRSFQISSTKTFGGTGAVGGPGIHAKYLARLEKQLQPAVSWYTFWVMPLYMNQTTHIYVACKTSGLEIGKKDNDLPACLEIQEYISDLATPKTPVQDIVANPNAPFQVHEVWIVPNATAGTLEIRVDVNGVKAVQILDQTKFGGNSSSCPPGSSQYIGTGWQRNGTTGQNSSSFMKTGPWKFTLYAEGSQVSFDQIQLQNCSSIGQAFY